MDATNSGRIQIHGQGIGEISEGDIERRAAEIARMDGREHAGEQDRFRAREELLHPGPPAPPEADERSEPIKRWGKGPASTGQRAEHFPMDDEETAAERLVQEGVEEAERDRRLSAEENRPSE